MIKFPEVTGFFIWNNGELFMKRNISQIITRMTTIAILSALGTVIMLFVKIPNPISPWLEIEFSDTIILVGYALYGLPGALSIALMKTFFSFLYQGVGYFAIGQIAALLTSLSFILGIYIFSRVLHWFKKGLKYRILSYVFIGIIVTVIMTVANFIFITPTFISGQWATFYNSDIIAGIERDYAEYGSNYVLITIVLYVPFNLVKAFIVQFVYEIVFNRLIFVLFKNNDFVQKYFIGTIEKKKICSNGNKKNRKKNKKVPDICRDECELNSLLESCKKEDNKQEKISKNKNRPRK